MSIDKYLGGKGIREYGKGIEEVVKTIILPGFLLATPGIVSALSSGFQLKNFGSSYLINIGIFTGGLIAAFFLLKKKDNLRLGKRHV